MQIQKQIADLIDKVRQDLPEKDQLDGVISALQALPHVLIFGGLVFREYEYEIKVGSANTFDGEIAALEQVKPLDLVAAPELVELLPINPARKEAVLVTRYKALEGEWLETADQTRAPFHPEACEQLREDMTKLAEAGFVHPYVRSISHWIVSSESSTLFLDGWHALGKGSERARAEMLEAVDAILASRCR
ncbi:MAG: hypothetical protein F9K40_00940 [Kofleriaceae bacterium]|nr:MAG: hypothetical protein F9K40_00940 [Kofleriaceae bacterium]MBZ0236445.1 hypothetical protein [Kofleriaceae bacterium]